MVEKEPAKGKGEEKAPKPKEKPDLIRDLWREQTRLKLHLTDGTVIEGRIKQFDQYNLQVKTDDKRYWVPKHAVVYAEML
jgi:sRNA-binding regulator protein Hfq